MKLNFLQLPSEDRKLYIEEAAGRRGLSPVILEKDFWVCCLAMAELALLSVPGVEMSRVRRGNHDRATSAWMRMRIDRLRPLSHH